MTTIRHTDPGTGLELEFKVLGNGVADWSEAGPTHFINSVGTILPLGAMPTTHENWMYLRLVSPYQVWLPQR